MSTAAFEAYLRDKGRSGNTIIAYGQAVQRFAKWYLQTTGFLLDPAALTRPDLRDYRQHLHITDGLAPATVNSRLAALRAWGAWLVETKQVAANPTDGITPIKQVTVAPHWPTRKEMGALERELERAVNNARTGPAKFLASRDRAIVLLLANTGLRVAELCALQPDDLKLSERAGSALVRHGKGDKRRSVPVNADARRALAPWLDLRPPAAVNVFADLYGVSLQPRGVQLALKDYCRRAGVSITPHQLRHYFAKSLIDTGANVLEVAALLGHSNINTTRIYTVPSQRDLELAVEKLEG